jgi:thiamine-phosphate pyrophosphorylase
VRIVAITDRRLMVPADTLAHGVWTAIADAFAAAIARVARVARDELVVQVREKDLDGRPLLALVCAALATGARVVVNDRLDVALAAGAHGVHLPERGLAIADAHRLAPRSSIGVSCHSIDGVRAALAAGADVIQLGPIWDTPGKGPAIGLPALEEARAVIGERARLDAVGGITTRARAEEALAAGAHGVAAIRAVWSGALFV